MSRRYSTNVPSPPSRMPSVEDPRSLGMSSRSGLTPNLHLGSNIEGSGFLDVITKVGTKLGDPFKKRVGVNPFTMGYDLGEKVIAPALMKVIPPRGRGVRNLSGVGILLGGQKGMRAM